jgi:hypothetical protein
MFSSSFANISSFLPCPEPIYEWGSGPLFVAFRPLLVDVLLLGLADIATFLNLSKSISLLRLTFTAHFELSLASMTLKTFDVCLNIQTLISFDHLRGTLINRNS